MNCPRCRRHLWYEAGLSHPPEGKSYSLARKEGAQVCRPTGVSTRLTLETGEGLLLPQGPGRERM